MMFLRDAFSGLVNRVTGVGTSRDKFMANTWVFNKPTDDELLNLFRSSWIAKKMVTIPVDDMLREGWKWQANNADTTKLEAEERRLGLKDALHDALVRDGIYGGAAIIVGHESASETELTPEQVGLNGIDYLLVMGRGEITVKDIELDPVKGYGKPTMYQVQGKTGTVYIHPSRVFPFIRNPVYTGASINNISDFWGDSRLAAVSKDIAAADSGIMGVGRLMSELAITYFKFEGLNTTLGTAEGEKQIQQTLSLIDRMRSSLQSVAIDLQDEFEVVTSTFAGIPEAMRELMQNVAGAGDIPYTRFMGASPDGLNATGISDIRNYQDRLAGERGHYVESQVERLDQLLIPSALGSPDTKTYRIWNPLWQLDEVEKLKLDVDKMTMYGEMRANMIVHDHVIEQVVKNTMIESPNFPGAEKAFKEAESMPTPSPAEVEAAVSLQAGAGQPSAARPSPRVVGGTSVGDEDEEGEGEEE